jgi:hypothetical protein
MSGPRAVFAARRRPPAYVERIIGRARARGTVTYGTAGRGAAPARRRRRQKNSPRRCADWRSHPSMCAAQSVRSTDA